ncbi:MAG: cyclic nucleotide-binding domain-containing protein [Lentimicrobiaceae bacterium]|nr:cyclic nucleotide-binding domain-containing protein [Lentimicrobiaceae bacterium]
MSDNKPSSRIIPMTSPADPDQIAQRLDFLRQVEVFSDLPGEVLTEICSVIAEERKKSQEIVFRKGDIGNAMYMIAEGSVRVHVGDHVLARLGAGKVFGEFALLDSSPRSASITTEEQTLLYRLDRIEFTRLMESNTLVMYGVIRLVLRRIREMNELESKLAQSYLKIQKQNREIEIHNQNIRIQKQELEKKNEELHRLNEEKFHLINVLAHDLRNPLTSSLCLADLLKSQTENLTRDQVKSVEVIDNSLRKINRIIDQIVDINEIETRSMALRPQKVNLAIILKEITELYRYALAQKNINLMTETTDLFSVVDPNYASLIIENLLSNAIKFSPAGKNIWIRLYQQDDRARIEIRDEGPGINEQDMMKLYGKYQHRHDKVAGIGKEESPGLSIVVKYVMAMNGKVWCKSEAGKGSTLFVEFPIASPDIW